MAIPNSDETPRTKCKRLIARQIAISQGYVWRDAPNTDQLKKQMTLLVLAENILATVERCLRADLDHIQWQ